MLRSTLEKVLPQLERIADELRIHRTDRNAFFRPSEKVGNVLVNIGEIHMGSEHRLEFDVSGTLIRGWWLRWPVGESIYYHPLKESRVAELRSHV
jgi:hypothetical protein